MKLDPKETVKNAGYVGALLLLAGFLRYLIAGGMQLPSMIMLIAGAVLLLGSLVLNFRAVLGFFSRRSARLGTNTAVLTVAVIVILGLANFLGYKHHRRFDMTSEKLYTLSDQTRRIVKGLQKDVQILRFSKEQDPNLRDEMTEYTDVSPRLHYQRVDPDEKPEVAKQYGVTRAGEVVVTSGSRLQHLNDTTEQNLTSAILKVTSDTVKTVCFVEGHDEKSISSTDSTGYSTVKEELQRENYEVRSVNLVSAGEVPADCSVLVVAGPTKAYFPQEAAMIGKYLDAGGKALVMVDPDTDAKLEDIFKSWNIVVGHNTVVDASGVGRLIGTGPAVPLVMDYGAHPITRGFERTMTFFPLAQTVAIANRSETQPDETELLKTSPRSFEVPKITGTTVKFDPKTNQAGPLSLAVAAERKAGGKDARLVVIGDSDFATNRWVNLQRNGDLFFNTIDWLAQEENLISIRPKNPTSRRVVLTARQARLLAWFDMAILPGLVIACGIVIWWKRR